MKKGEKRLREGSVSDTTEPSPKRVKTTSSSEAAPVGGIKMYESPQASPQKHSSTAEIKASQKPSSTADIKASIKAPTEDEFKEKNKKALSIMEQFQSAAAQPPTPTQTLDNDSGSDSEMSAIENAADERRKVAEKLKQVAEARRVLLRDDLKLKPEVKPDSEEKVNPSPSKK